MIYMSSVARLALEHGSLALRAFVALLIVCQFLLLDLRIVLLKACMVEQNLGLADACSVYVSDVLLLLYWQVSIPAGRISSARSLRENTCRHPTTFLSN